MEPPEFGTGGGVVRRLAAWFRTAGPARQASFVLVGYLAVSVAIYAAPILTELGSRYVGIGKGDAKLYVWSLAWLPWALTHGGSILETTRVFAPQGADLTWVTTLPAPALALWPITAAFSPIVSLNVLLLLAPALAGWATFLLCRAVTDRFWPAVAGGYLFGFSSYMVNQLHGHANLVMIWPVPLAAYLVVRRIRGTIRPRSFVAGLAGSLLFLFGSSTELFATATLFGVLAFAIALALGGAERGRVFAAGLLVAAGYAVVGVLLLPFLLPALGRAPAEALRPMVRASVDLFSFAIPRAHTFFGGERFAGVTARFTASLVEDGGYLGPALLLMLGVVAVTCWRRREAWGLLAFIAIAAVLSMGPVLHVLGEERGYLPGAALTRVPLIEHATPQRFTAYMALAVAVLAAWWLARGVRTRPWRWAVVGLGAISILPLVTMPPFHREQRIPEFIASGAFAEVLAPDEIVYVIPAAQGDELAWQVAADHRFRLAQGYLGPIPVPYRGLGGSRGLALDHPSRRMPALGDLARWFDVHEVGAVLVDAPAQPLFRVVLEAMGWEGGPVRDVWVYRRGPDAIVPGQPPLPFVQPFTVGAVAPPLVLPTLDGGEFRVADARGRPVVLVFVASWCFEGCADQVEGIRGVLAAGTDAEVVAVLVSDEPAAARAFLDAAGLTLPAVLDPDGVVYLGTGSAIVPTTVVIGADGVVRKVLVDPIEPAAYPRVIGNAVAASGVAG